MKKNLLKVLMILIMVQIQRTAHAQTDIRCQNNGSLSDASDDYISFNLSPTPPVTTFEAPYTYSITATQSGGPITLVLADGSAASDLSYGYISPFRTPNGTAGLGNITLTVTPNFGAYPAVSYTLADPGSCVLSGPCEAGEKTISYSYRSPFNLTDALGWQTFIPKFNNTTGKTLTGVQITSTASATNSLILENMGSTPRTSGFSAEVDASFQFDMTDLPNTNLVGIINSGSASLPVGVFVPASGSWLGDVPSGSSNFSTVERMLNDGWLRGAIYAQLDPTLDPRWVTNATGNASDASDMLVSVGQSKSASNNYLFSTPTDLSKFTGSTGNIPITYTALGNSFATGGGNINSKFFTQTFFTIDLTYTYQETCTPLPVELKTFGVKKVENNVVIDWSVAQEFKFSHYEVEHSTNAKTFFLLTSVPATGNDHYTAVHKKAAPGVHYYRLKSIDLDGTYAYSRMVQIEIAGEQLMKIYPNPTSNVLSIEINENDQVSEVRFLNVNGVLCKRMIFNGLVSKTIQVGDLADGTYLIQLDLKDGQTKTQKVVITK